MTNSNRIYATLQLVRAIIVPAKIAQRCSQPLANAGMVRIQPDDFAGALAALDSLLRPDGRLELLFTGTLAPAAPFLLFHLKRQGFSECKAAVSSEGVIVTARR